MTPDIRPFAADDAGRVLEICIAAFTPIHEGFRAALGDDIFLREFPRWREDYRDTMAAIDPSHASDRVFVAEDEGRILGFVFTHFEPARGRGEIGLNAVDPGFQRRGIGRALCSAGLEDLAARGAAYVYVGTGGDAAHAPARAAYRALGFDRVVPSLHLYRPL